MKELVIIQKQDQKEIAYVEDGTLKEHYTEKEDKKRLEGNIYIGKVENVLSGMQAAFVDIGQEKKAFLHIRDVLPKKSNVTGNKEEDLENYNIKDYIKPNQMVLVQVKKDSNNSKGARVSTNIQVAGRFVVILPENDFITVSQKIEDKEERNRLITIVNKVKKDKKIGIIIRTAAEKKEEKLLQKDLQNAMQKLENLQKEFEKQKEKKQPTILQQTDTILERILLDLADNGLDKILVNTKKLQDEIKKILISLQEEVVIPVELEKENLENKYDIENQVQKLQNRKIWLKCGGFITIDKTEALTAIDVNSRKIYRKRKLRKNSIKSKQRGKYRNSKAIKASRYWWNYYYRLY